MSPITDVRNEITKALESTDVPKPLYAVAGAGDLALEKLRDAEKRFHDLNIGHRLSGLGDEARGWPDRVRHMTTDVQGRVRELPASMVEVAVTASDKAGEVYEELNVRGRKVMASVTSQQAVTITDPGTPNGAEQGTRQKAQGTDSASTTASTAKTGTPRSGGTRSTGAKSTTAKSATAKSGTAKSATAKSGSAKSGTAKSATGKSTGAGSGGSAGKKTQGSQRKA